MLRKAILEGDTASDSAKLGGQPPEHYATKAVPTFSGPVTIQNGPVKMNDGYYIMWNTGWYAGAQDSNQYNICKAPSGHGNRQLLFGVVGGTWSFISTNTCDLGHPYYNWSNEYFVTAPVISSDRNTKKDIKSLNAARTQEFIAALNPSSFQYKDGTSGRTHYGMISQEVEEAMRSVGMSDLDFAGLIKSPKIERIQAGTDENGEPVYQDKVIEGEYVYGLRYEEFIAPIISVCQSLMQENAEIKERMEALEKRLEALEKKSTK